MGGKGSGRRRKPTPILKLQGQFRADRHGDRSDVELATGKPIKPQGMPPVADAMWEHLTGCIHEDLLAEADSSCLEGLCRWYAVWQSAMSEADTRTASVAWGHFATMSTRFGMSPTDRSKIKLTPKDLPKDPMEDLLG